ncbi:MAG: hypothetical protein IJR88_06875 [Clostridia bacterium]|nr:hypothetical protein [Clostridia bacterium]
MKRVWILKLLLAAGLILSLFVLDPSPYLLPTLMAALLHECGHLLAFLLLKIPLSGVSVGFFGMRLRSAGRLLSYGEEWLLSASGPLASLFGAALGALLWNKGSFFASFSCASLLLGLLNLAPIRSFDGGRMLECFLSTLLDPEKSRTVLYFCSCACLFFFFALSSYLFLLAGEGVGFFFFSAGLFFRFLFDEKNEIF